LPRRRCAAPADREPGGKRGNSRRNAHAAEARTRVDRRHLYWIVKHRLVAGIEILRFEDREDGRIDIVCCAELKAVSPTPRRAHQGWRYLEDVDAPSGEDDGSGLGQLPPQLYGKLASLALV
jgi:hypothetical protein